MHFHVTARNSYGIKQNEDISGVFWRAGKPLHVLLWSEVNTKKMCGNPGSGCSLSRCLLYVRGANKMATSCSNCISEKGKTTEGSTNGDITPKRFAAIKPIHCP